VQVTRLQGKAKKRPALGFLAVRYGGLNHRFVCFRVFDNLKGDFRDRRSTPTFV
jgi:hypothetical protein